MEMNNVPLLGISWECTEEVMIKMVSNKAEMILGVIMLMLTSQGETSLRSVTSPLTKFILKQKEFVNGNTNHKK